MADVWVIGTYSTAFRKWPDRTHRDLAEELASTAVSAATRDPRSATRGPRAARSSGGFGTLTTTCRCWSRVHGCDALDSAVSNAGRGSRVAGRRSRDAAATAAAAATADRLPRAATGGRALW